MMAIAALAVVGITVPMLAVMIGKKWLTLRRAVIFNTIIDLIFVGIAASSIEFDVVYILCMLLLLVPATDIALIVGVSAAMKTKENQQSDHPTN